MIVKTMQEWLDIARARIEDGRGKSENAPGQSPRCLYRRADGNACFIGAAADEATARRWDEMNLTAKDLYEAGRIDVSDLREGYRRAFFISLQGVHDGCKPVFWAQQIDALEERYRKFLEE